jgi:uncharacterized protein (DUF1330 family)
MPAYLIAIVNVHDAERFREYRERVTGLIEQHGGRYLVRGGRMEVLEGDWSPPRVAIIEFPDREAAQAFYDDPAYEPLRSLRQAVTTSDLLLVEGVTDPRSR